MHVVYASSDHLAPLRAMAKGLVYGPVDNGWDDARLAWNLAADQHPTGVLVAEDAADVATGVRFARDSGLRVAVQATGHGAMPLGCLRDTLLIRTRRMARVEVDPVAARARVEAGATWRDVIAATSPRGLAPLAGAAPSVGVAGYTLGGGIGYLARRFGLAANRVSAIELVDAEGRMLRADARHERDLFWALRGGGGSFGAVTALELELERLPSFYGGTLMWPWEQAGRVLASWREWVATVPDELTSVGRLLQFPDSPAIPAELRGRGFVAVAAAHAGDAYEGARAIAPLRALGPEIDTFAALPPSGLLAIHGGPDQPTAVGSAHVLLDDLPAHAVDALVAAAGPGSGSPLATVDLRHLGGALATEPQGAGALGKVDGLFAAFAAGPVPDPAAASAVKWHARSAMGSLAPWTAYRTYANFADQASNTRAFFPIETYQRLQEVKGDYDPEDLFRANHPIPVGPLSS